MKQNKQDIDDDVVVLWSDTAEGEREIHLVGYYQLLHLCHQCSDQFPKINDSLKGWLAELHHIILLLVGGISWICPIIDAKKLTSEIWSVYEGMVFYYLSLLW